MIINLDQCVLDALTFLSHVNLPKINVPYKRPLVVGSGNAYYTGHILFHDKDAVFADEGSFKQKLKVAKNDGAVLISASGEKHAPVIEKYLKRKHVHNTLITCNPEASAVKFSNKIIVFPSMPEPYSYNVSTYLGMILSKTKENPASIKKFIETRVAKKIPALKKYDSYFLVIPPELELLREMFLTKFDELFGPRINGRVFSSEQAKHAKDIVTSDKELFVSFDSRTRLLGKNRLNIPMPKNASYATLMAIGYYFIGRIQKANPPYFKKSLPSYLKRKRVF